MSQNGVLFKHRVLKARHRVMSPGVTTPFFNVFNVVVSADLRVETDTFGSRVRIASDKSRNYLCFSRRGKLIVRVSTNLRLVIIITLRLQQNLSYTDNPLYTRKKAGIQDFPDGTITPQFIW